jgi:hypothetical protein
MRGYLVMTALDISATPGKNASIKAGNGKRAISNKT